MPLSDLVLLLAAAFGAGTLNAVAGGGSFLTLPALVSTGLPAVAANATGTAALLPGYAASAWALRDKLDGIAGVSNRRLVVLSLLGGAFGAWALTVTPEASFRRLVPWLLLAATALFAFGDRLTRLLRRNGAADGALPSPRAVDAAVLACSVYGGYFNGGLGVLLLAAFALLGQTDLARMNAAKNLVSVVLTAIAVALYARAGLVAWGPALLMMVGAVAGGYLGGRLARRLSRVVLRAIVVAVGLVTAAVFFVRG